MTLTFFLTSLAVWCIVSVPAALLIASMMRVQAERADEVYAADIETAYRKTA